MVNGERIRQARELRRMTQTKLAESSGVAQAAIAKIENGELNPSESLLKAIALQTGFPVAFFNREIARDFPLGSLLFRAHAAATVRDRTEAYRYGQITFEIAHHLAQRVECPALRLPQLREHPSTAAGITRAQFGLSPDTPIPHLVKIVESSGVRVLALPIDLEDRDAFSLWVGNEIRTPVIFLARNRPGDRQRFSLAHELGHLVLHHAIRGQVSSVESEANQFAAELLMPEMAMRREIMPPVTLTSLARLKPRWRVSIQALIRRAHDLEIITKRQYAYLFERVGANGWRLNEPSYLDIAPEKPRGLRQMAELLYGVPINIARLADELDLSRILVKEILDAHAERTGAFGKPQTAPVVSINRRSNR
jgi:Zn-dependent peptidase ImmA (M78 family)/DNA-binding XRE family transcriptional regulator